MGCGMSGGNSGVCEEWQRGMWVWLLYWHVANERDLKGSLPRKEEGGEMHQVVSSRKIIHSFEIYIKWCLLVFSQNFIHVRFNQKILAPVGMLFGFRRPSA